MKRANIRICKVCNARLIDEEAYHHIMTYHRDAVVRSSNRFERKMSDSYVTDTDT